MERSKNGRRCPSSLKTAVFAPPSTSISTPVGLCINIESPCPMFKNDTRRSCEGNAKIQTHTFPKINTIRGKKRIRTCYNARMSYSPKTFSFPALQGISPKQLEVHLKLYEGYVKFLNTLERSEE